jgi:predicted TIM-barrel fold metal-dependent hydrolase
MSGFAMIDMHTHLRPAALIEMLRQRQETPRIYRNERGQDVLKTRAGEQPLYAHADLDAYLKDMDRLGVETSVISDPGAFRWGEGLSPEAEAILYQEVNDAYSSVAAKYPGRFASFAMMPMGNIGAAAAEFERALKLPGVVGAQLPGNAFLSQKDAEAVRPLLEIANRERAILFVHHGPRPGDATPRYDRTGIDNPSPRYQTLEMQSSLSSIMITLCMTDILDSYPDLHVLTHNLGGNIPFEVERLDHRSINFTPDKELPSVHFKRSRVAMDCNSFGPYAIEAAIRLYGPDRIVSGTDGTAFGVEWTQNAVRDAQIGDAARQKILTDNARKMLDARASAARH